MDVVRLYATTVKPLSFMFRMRFWPCNAQRIVSLRSCQRDAIAYHDGQTDEADVTTVLDGDQNLFALQRVTQGTYVGADIVCRMDLKRRRGGGENEEEEIDSRL